MSDRGDTGGRGGPGQAERPSFTVRDRRRFDTDGKERSGGTVESPVSKAPVPGAPAPERPDSETRGSEIRGSEVPGPKATPAGTTAPDPDGDASRHPGGGASHGPGAHGESGAHGGSGEQGGPGDAPRGGRPAPESPDGDDVSFSSFVMSMAHQALWQLGVAAPPDGLDVPVDRLAAKQTIDVIAMLEARTAGNLDEMEERLVREILHELRIHFVRSA